MDTGITLNFLLDHIRERRPRSLKVCALIDKPGERKVEVQAGLGGLHAEGAAPADRFLVGYGLDYAEHYRGLPVHRDASPGRARRPRGGRSRSRRALMAGAFMRRGSGRAAK